MASDRAGTIFVDGYADLASDRSLHENDPDVVARELSEHGHKDDWLIGWSQEWVFDEKPIEAVDGSQQVVSGRIDVETEKAYLVAVGRDEAWLPKSVVRRYVVEDAREISVPQQGITDYGEGSA